MRLKDTMINLGSIESLLPVLMRAKFYNEANHASLVQTLNQLNSAFVPILDHMVCFKSEVGLCLQRMIESYNVLFVKQFKLMIEANEA
jgi:hypothetical protein